MQRFLSSHMHVPWQALLPVVEGMQTQPTWLLHRPLDRYAAHLRPVPKAVSCKHLER